MNRRPAPSISALKDFEPTPKEAAEHQRKLIEAQVSDNPDFRSAKRELDIQRGDILPDGTPRIFPTAKDGPSITLKVLRQGERDKKREEEDAAPNQESKPSPPANPELDQTIIDKRVPRHPETVSKKRQTFVRVAVCIVGLGLLGWFVVGRVFRGSPPERMAADARMTTAVAGMTATATATATVAPATVASSVQSAEPSDATDRTTAASHASSEAFSASTAGSKRSAPTPESTKSRATGAGPETLGGSRPIF